MIPKIVHFCWLSGEPFPELITQCQNSWKEHLPDFQFILWDLKKVEGIGNTWLKQTIGAKKWAFAADFIRIYAVSQYGGVYLDADVEIVAPVDPFLNHDFFIGFEYNNDLEPAIFGAVAGHPWLADLLHYYQDREFISNNGIHDTRPLPTIFNELAAHRYGFKPNGKMLQIDSEKLAIYPCDYFSPKNIYYKKIKRTSNTVAIHHFDGSWVKKDGGYRMKQFFHRLLYALGGKMFHSQLIQIIRRISL